MLKRRLEFYKGKTQAETPIEPILSDKMLLQIPLKEVNIQLGKRKENREVYLLSGYDILTCGYCQGMVKASITTKKNQPKEKRSYYYLCSRKQVRGYSQCKESKLKRQDLIDDLVVSDLKIRLSSPDIVDYIQELRRKVFADMKEIECNTNFLPNQHALVLKDFEVIESRIDEFKEYMMSQEFYFSDEIYPVQMKLNNKQNLINSMKRNINQITLFNDRLEIVFRFPINKNLEFKKVIPIQ